MNLNPSSPASVVIWATNALAVAGSLYSSTKRIRFCLPSLPVALLGHRAQPSGGSRAAEDARDDLRSLLHELAYHTEGAGRQVAHLLGGVDGLPCLLEFGPGIRPGPA